MKMRFRQGQLAIMGCLAIVISPLVLLSANMAHGVRFLNSISESAAIAGGTVDILPFVLGALAIFSFSYAKWTAYDRLDAICTYSMAFGFTLVAMQQCASGYLQTTRVGVLGLNAAVSDTIHSIGAMLGFGSMIMWILFCFRKSDKPRKLRTPEKNRRNNIYTVLGLCMVSALGLFVVDLVIRIPHIVFWAEFLMLVPGGLACIVKSERCGGQLFADRKNARQPVFSI